MGFSAPTSSVLSGPQSEWRRDITTAPLHPQSSHIVDGLIAQTRLAAPTLNCYRYGLAVYEVDDAQPGVNINWPGRNLENQLYAGLLGIDRATAVTLPKPYSFDTMPPSTGAFRNVPIPDGVKPAIGTDGALSIYRPSTRELWEFWQARQDSVTRQWSASWGGYIPDLQASDGRYSGGLGVSASGLIAASGQITIREAQAGRVDHAMALAIPHVLNGWSYPATRCDGSGTSATADALFEGQRLRLAADVDVDALTLPPDWRGRRLPVSPICKVIARGAQQWGFIVTDRAGAVAISAEEGLAAKVAGVPVNPWDAILTKKAPYASMAGFPWERLEALPFNHGKP